MYETLRPEDFGKTHFSSLIRFRINRVLMICSNYDAFIMEEDGQIESQVYKEYVELNMSDRHSCGWNLPRRLDAHSKTSLTLT